jgi:hypothetical protein
VSFPCSARRKEDLNVVVQHARANAINSDFTSRAAAVIPADSAPTVSADADEGRVTHRVTTKQSAVGFFRLALVVSAAVAVVLAVAAGVSTAGTTQAEALWAAAQATGAVALLALYGVAIDWARRRKRLWG